MRNFQTTFETRKRSFISVFSICMTVPLIYFDFFIILENCSYIALFEKSTPQNIFSQSLERLNFGYFLKNRKNTPTLDNKNYKIQVIQKTEEFSKKIQCKSI